MNCCRHTVGAFAAAFCDELNIALAELANVLSLADATGLANDPVVVSAHAVYEDRSSFAVYANFLGDACQKDTAEVSTAAEKVRALLKERTGIEPPALRPDYKPHTPEDLPLWLKIGGVALIGTVGLIAIAYITGQAATVAKLFKVAKRPLSGHRRRRRLR